MSQITCKNLRLVHFTHAKTSLFFETYNFYFYYFYTFEREPIRQALSNNSFDQLINRLPTQKKKFNSLGIKIEKQKFRALLNL